MESKDTKSKKDNRFKIIDIEEREFAQVISPDCLSRSDIRVFALEFLFQLELRNDSYEENLEKFIDMVGYDLTKSEFFIKLTRQVHDHLEEIDNAYSKYLKDDWKLSRINKVNVVILRLAVCEILYFDDIPVSVSINEAILMTKAFADSKDYSFINGILSSFVKNLDK